MSKQIGLDMKLFRNTASFASPTWNEIQNVRDLNGPDAYDEADVSRRLSGVKQTEPTLRDISYDWEMVYDLTDLDFAAIQDAFTGRTLIELALADGAIGTAGTVASGGTAGVKVLRVECKIFKFERSESLAGANLYSITAKPCFSANAPAYAIVA